MKTQSIFFSFTILLLLINLSFSEKCNPEDKKVLLKIKKDLNNPYILSSWNPKVDCCDWYTIECDLVTNRIIALTIFGGSLPGQIPDAVGDLTYLQILTFRKLTNLTGTIPFAISKLKHLKEVRLSWTNIYGPVPDFFSTLSNLTFLDLSFNKLTGSIPSSFSKLKNLDALHLDRNLLTGEIPNSFGQFSGKVPDLYLSHNKLTGKIPASFGKMNFGTIDLSRNNLTGDASMLFKTNKSFAQIDISRNMFEFDFTNVKVPAGISYLDINHNKIFGSLPESMTLPAFQFLNVTYNRLCGKIPTGGTLQTFDNTTYFHNRCLCGAPLPACK